MAYDALVSPYPNEPDPWPAPRDDTPPRPAPRPARPAEHDAVPEPVEYPTDVAPRPTAAPGYSGENRLRLATGARPPLDPLTLTRIIAAWLAIVGCTVALYFLQAAGMEQMAKDAASDTRPGFQALYLARYSVGMEQFLGGQTGPIMAQYDAIAASSTYPELAGLRGAVLAGDLIGRSEAVSRLGSIYLGEVSQPLPEEDLAIDQLIPRIYHDQTFVPTSAQRDALIQRHGYFGELAAGYNLPPSDPIHRDPRFSAQVVFISLMSLILIVGLALLTGIVLLVVLIYLLASGTQRLAMPRGPAGHRVVYLEVVALFLIGFIVLQLAFGLLGEFTGWDWTPAFLLLSPVVLLWPRIAGVPWKQFCHDMGFYRGQGIFAEIGSGIGGYLAGLPIIAVGFGLTFLLGWFSGDSADHPMQQEMSDGRLYSVLLLLAAAVVWAPLVEESIFRSAFYRHLRQVGGVPSWLIATVVTSFIFAAIHPQGWIGIPVLMSIAFVLAGLREWRGSIIPSMVAHALHNGVITLVLMIILYA